LIFFKGVPENHPLIKKIKELDVNKLTPLEALKKISEFQDELLEENK